VDVVSRGGGGGDADIGNGNDDIINDGQWF
jgi:hypothetical protein